MISGADISNVNGAVDLAQLRRDYRLDFAILKATEGTGFRDPLFPAAWAAVRELGLARGCYHFAHPAQDAREQADAFTSYVRSNGLLDGDMLALDLEETDGLQPYQVDAWAAEFCRAVAAETGHVVTVYTFLSFAEAGCCASLGRQPLWMADPDSTPGCPRVPAPWKTWAVHQYSSQGIDLDVASYPDAAAMTLALGRIRPAPPTPAPRKDDDMPVFSPIALPPYGGPAVTASYPTAAVTLDLSSAGTYKAIGFSSDWSLAGQPQPAIRVAVHSVAKGFSQVVHDLLIPQAGKAVVTFAEHDVDYVSVCRVNASPALVSAGT